MPFKIIRDDITRVKADAIVNTANPEPCCGSGTDGAIYHAAGEKELLAERNKIGRIAPGEAAVTAAFRLPATYIIHTVGPVWIDGEHGEFEILRSCYRKSLLLAETLGCESIAFPLIATGVYGFPKNQALDIALSVIREHLEDSELSVILVVFSQDSYQIAANLNEQIEEYIDENYVAEQTAAEYEGVPVSGSGYQRRARRKNPFAKSRHSSMDMSVFLPQKDDDRWAEESAVPQAKASSLDEAVNNLGETFQQRLFRMIDERGMSDPQVYKHANVDRKLFSKIRCSEDYIPKKKTIIALAIALKLNLDDTRDLLASAGLALTNNSKSDVIIRFCIENNIYDIFEVNSLLFQFDQPILC